MNACMNLCRMAEMRKRLGWASHPFRVLCGQQGEGSFLSTEPKDGEDSSVRQKTQAPVWL